MEYCENMISKNIRKNRIKMGISQSELAEKLYVTQQAVCKWESGQTYPQADKLLNLANFFDIPLQDLLYDDEAEPKPRYYIDQTDMIREDLERLQKKHTLSYAEKFRMVADEIALKHGRCGCSMSLTDQEYNEYLTIRKYYPNLSIDDFASGPLTQKILCSIRHSKEIDAGS